MHFSSAAVALVALANSLTCLALSPGHLAKGQRVILDNHKLQCPLPKPYVPSPSDGSRPSLEFWSNATIEKQVQRLSAVVAVPSICYDDLGDVDEDARWKSFNDLHNVLRDLFPLV